MGKGKFNNQGFTVVELIVSFSVTLIVVSLLFNIVLDLKDLYVKDGVKTELLIKQGLITKNTIEGINTEDLTSIAKCASTTNCYRFTYQDGTTKDLIYNTDTNIYQFGKFKTKLVSGSTFGAVTITRETITSVSSDKKNAMLTINIPITSTLVSGDYGIKIVHLYNSNQLTITGF